MTGGASYMFVASERHKGDFGISAWDLVCDADADEFHLAGDYLVWLSDDEGGNDAADTLPPGPFYTPLGAIIALSKADLLDGAIINPINTHADGTAAFGEFSGVFTGTGPDGLATGVDCDGWTNAVLDANNRATLGLTNNSDMGWTEGPETTLCVKDFSVYCVQVR